MALRVLKFWCASIRMIVRVALLPVAAFALSTQAFADKGVTELSNTLVQHFVQSYFRVDPRTAATSDYPIVKWPHEISISLLHPELLPKGADIYAKAVVAALRSSGFNIELNAAESDQANVSIIVFDATDGFSQSDLAILTRRMSGNTAGLKYFVSQFDSRSTCLMGGDFSKPWQLKSSFIGINANMPGAVIKHCLVSMIAGIVGFQGKVDKGVVRHSLFSSDTSSIDVSAWDRLAFQMLADPRLQAGMRYNGSTLSILHEIAETLIATWPDPEGLEEQMQAH
ncbi:DUF2927 domain-containing protein [Dongia rigui]|uniref:DUF2927 domain-containing protein n=1 Tax=Dongia rigui TaxID=940149 RepID=A0ABU5E258_9PROT|nr:DUF2927 domain-containing protein [Dongia rigui]MDY0872896.1 DUF2927 domain-containing protein [Dongia rigui]